MFLKIDRGLKYFFLLLIAMHFSIESMSQSAKYKGLDLIQYEGAPYYINGLNVPWNKFGGDFGNHELWGSLYESAWFENMFKECQANGVNVVRMWIHCDGRANPEFDEKGYCIGFDPDFFMDLDDLFRIAQKYEVMVMPCLWSFDMCKDSRESAGEFAGNHQDLLTDSLKMESYLQKCFIPLVKRYANQCNLFAWEICNEPEWALDRSAIPTDNYWEYRTLNIVPISAMQTLTAKMASIVHRYSNKMVTTGSAAIRWNSDVEPSAVVNLWSDKMLKGINNDSLAFLDFYQIHYYDHFKESGSDPYDTTRNINYWKFDKPTIIGETPASKEKSKFYTPTQMLENALTNGYSGTMFWCYEGGDGHGSWKDFKDANKTFYEKHPKIVRPTDFPCLKINPESISLKANKTEKTTNLTWYVNKVAWVDKFEVVSKNLDNTETLFQEKIQQNGRIFEINLDNEVLKNSNYLFIKQKDVFGYQNQTKPFIISSEGIKIVLNK